jgi:hypothetical protein
VLFLALAWVGGCANGRGRDESQAPALDVPARHVRGDGFTISLPAGVPPFKPEGRYWQTEGTAAQVDETITGSDKIEVGFNVYHSPVSEFQQRPDVWDWASHPLASDSRFRRPTINSPRVERVVVPGAADAAMSVSEHPGLEQFGTGGMKSLSMRLFVKPREGRDGWVIGAYANGEAVNPELEPQSRLARILEQSLRSFRPSSAPASGSRRGDSR